MDPLARARVQDDRRSGLSPKTGLGEVPALLLPGSRGETHTWFGRIEAADRLDTRITIIEHPDGSHEHLVDSRRLQVAQLAAGYLRGHRVRAASVGVGVRGSISFLPAELRDRYRARRPVSFAVYASVRPASSAEHHHE